MAHSTRRRWLIPAAVLGAIGLAVGAFLFQPWLLLVDSTLDESLPPAQSASPSQPAAPGPTRAAGSSTPPPATTVLSSGRLISHEHQTSGRVKIIELADGSRVLRLEGLATTTGPDLRVWLSAGPVIAGRAGWFVFDDHPYVELGKLKANRGNQNYPIPQSAKLDELTSVAIWCKRFSVSFGAAALEAA